MRSENIRRYRAACAALGLDPDATDSDPAWSEAALARSRDPESPANIQRAGGQLIAREQFSSLLDRANAPGSDALS